MRIAIVGAGGQVGSAILQRLAKCADISIFGITRNDFAAEPLRYRGFEIRAGSVLDPSNCRRLLESSDLIVNAALHIGLPNAAREKNETIVRNLIEQSRGASVIHFSSVAVYGSCHQESYSTFLRPRGDSTYAREKFRLEQFASSIAARLGCNVAILRLGHVYGPGQGFSKGIFADIETQRWRLPFDGALPSNSIQVNRLADAIPKVRNLCVGVKTFNAVNAPQVTWREIYDSHSTAAQLPRIGAMPSIESDVRRTAHRVQAQRSILGRCALSITQWLRTIPLKSLADARGVREAMDSLMLKLPSRFEEIIYARYQRFSAKQLTLGGGATPVPPWYFSDPVPGPNLLDELEMRSQEEGKDEEVQVLSKWYSKFAAPSWKLSVE